MWVWQHTMSKAVVPCSCISCCAVRCCAVLCCTDVCKQCIHDSQQRKDACACMQAYLCLHRHCICMDRCLHWQAHCSMIQMVCTWVASFHMQRHLLLQVLHVHWQMAMSLAKTQACPPKPCTFCNCMQAAGPTDLCYAACQHTALLTLLC